MGLNCSWFNGKDLVNPSWWLFPLRVSAVLGWTSAGGVARLGDQLD